MSKVSPLRNLSLPPLYPVVGAGLPFQPNLDLFNEKITPRDPQGTRNVDILTNGIAGNFYDLGKMSWSVITAVLDWADTGKLTSYAKMIDRMDTPYLTSVNGDDDNPR